MKRLLGIFCILLGYCVGQDIDQVYSRLESSFKYGTKKEIMSALALYTDEEMGEPNKQRYVKVLQFLLDSPIIDVDVQRAVYRIIDKYQLNDYRNYYYTKVYNAILANNNHVDGDNKRVFEMTLYEMIKTRDKAYLPLFRDIWENKDDVYREKGVREDDLLALVIQGYRELGEPMDVESLKKLFEDSQNGDLRREIVKSVASFRREEDVGWLVEIIEGNGSKVLRWVALVSLKEYPKSPKAREEIKKWATQNVEKEMKVRAVSVLAETESPEEVKKNFVDLIRNDEEGIRLQAIDMIKERGSDPEILAILKYKADNDPSAKVREVSRELVKKFTAGREPQEE